MKNLITSLLVIALIGFVADDLFLNVKCQRLKNQLADSVLREDISASNAAFERITKAAADTQNIALESQDVARKAIEQRDEVIREWAKLVKEKAVAGATVAVNEKQGAHKFVYVDSPCWMDLMTGEKVLEIKKTDSPIEGKSSDYWTSGGVFPVPLSFSDSGAGGRNQ